MAERVENDRSPKRAKTAHAGDDTSATMTPLARAKAFHARYPLVDGHNDLPWALGQRVKLAINEAAGVGDLQRQNDANGGGGGAEAEAEEESSRAARERLAKECHSLRSAAQLECVGLQRVVNDLHTDIPKLKAGGLGMQFWSVYVPTPGDTVDKYGSLVLTEHQAVVHTLEQIDRVHRLVEKFPRTFEFCKTSAEAKYAFSRGKIACMMGAEGGHQIANSMGVLRMYKRMGVQYMTLTHNGPPAWADAAFTRDGKTVVEAKKGGLTAFGVEIVKEMNRIGMMVDLSHVHAETMRAALKVAKAPCIFSHSSARGVCPHPRNVPDDVLPLVKANNGVIQVTFVASFVSGPVRLNPGGKAVLSEVADHVCHIVKHCGIDHVGIGGDYDGCKDLPVGLENVSCYPQLTAELLRRGFTEEDCEKFLGGNVLRVWQACEDYASELRKDRTSLPSVARIEDFDY